MATTENESQSPVASADRIRRQRRTVVAAAVLVVVAGGYWVIQTVTAEPHPGDYDVNAMSNDLPEDRKLMWETQPLKGTPDPTHGPNPRSSTDRAINAASRVFNTVRLAGLTRKEVVETLGDPKSSNDSIYNFPFWSASENSLVYRFDSSAYGWQFNVKFDENGRCQSVKRHWIH